jgi:phage shock protein E
VRTREEFAGGHLAQALSIPLHELADRLPVDVPDKNTPLLLHCASGARSAAGKRTAEGLGYRTVVNVGSYGRAQKLTASP